MSYEFNIGGRCAPGVACATPMALPTYTQACAPRLPMPVYQPVIAPQQQFGIVGGPAYFTPPPVISYGSAYTCYNAGHQSYNQTIGTLSSIIIGAIFSTPMNGGAMPGQLSAQGGANPYAAYCPPGQDPHLQYDMNYQYQQNCGCQPQGYHPQPYPMPPVVDGGHCGGRGGYTECDPCKPRGPKPYDHIFNGPPPKHEGQTGPKGPEKCESDQWEGKANGEKGEIKINDRYTIKLDEKNSKWELYDSCEKKKTVIEGDPHLDLDGDGKWDAEFKKDATFVLEDGTKITVKTIDAGYANPNWAGATFSSELYITNGDKSIVVKGLAQDGSNGKDPDGELKVTVSHTNGKGIDKLIDDGAFTAYQVGDEWVTKDGQLTQAIIDNAENAYKVDDTKNARKGTDGNDNLKGTDTDDIFLASEGRDTIDGKGGSDTVVFDGDMEDYKITMLDDGRIKVENDGNITFLKDVEKLRFNDQDYTVIGASDGDDSNLGNGDEDFELVFGKNGNDQFVVNEESATPDYMVGGAGTDTVKLSGKSDDYDIEKEGDVYVIRDDNDNVVGRFTQMEKVQFNDKTIDVSSLT